MIRNQSQLDAGRPLDSFYDSTGAAMPELTLLDGAAVPEPYRKLLVHDHDMTPTLEAFFGREMGLRVIEKRIEENEMWREVVLVTVPEGAAAVFGAIRIFLDQFDAASRELILECRQPLGTILARQRVPHAGHPTAYFSITPDDSIAEALGLADRPTLYGRHNELIKPNGGVLAQVVEVLPVIAGESEVR